MILDDVFVNFDAERTRIAAALLGDFARQGHQLLVFTCHEHLWRLFQELKIDARRLPDREERQGEGETRRQGEDDLATSLAVGVEDTHDVDEPVPQDVEPPDPEVEDYLPEEDYVPEEAAELPPEPDEWEEVHEEQELVDAPIDSIADERPAPPVVDVEVHAEEPQPQPEEPVAEEVEYWWADEPVETRRG
jgi:hypothetical protein